MSVGYAGELYELRREKYLLRVAPQLSDIQDGFYLNVDLAKLGTDEFRMFERIRRDQRGQERSIVEDLQAKGDRYVLPSWYTKEEPKRDEIQELVSVAMDDLFRWEEEMVKIGEGGTEVVRHIVVWERLLVFEFAYRSLMDGKDGGGYGAQLVERGMDWLRSHVSYVKELAELGELRLSNDLRDSICQFASAIHHSPTFVVPILEASGGYPALDALLSEIGIGRVDDGNADHAPSYAVSATGGT